MAKTLYWPLCGIPPGITSSIHPASCPGLVLLILPLILNNIITLAVNFVFAREEYSIRPAAIRGYKRLIGKEPSEKNIDSDDDGKRWTPWAAILCVLWSVAVAAGTAALSIQGGFKADFQALFFLWLIRPRVLWAVLFYQVLFGKKYRTQAMDCLAQDAMTTILGIPFAVGLIQSGFAPEIDESLYKDCYFRVSSVAAINVSADTAPGYLFFSVIYIFIFVTFIWKCLLKKKQLHRGWAVGVFFISFSLCVMSWVIWVGFIISAGDTFCPTKTGPITALQVALPLITAFTRNWFSGGY